MAPKPRRHTLGAVGEFGLIRQLHRQWPATSPLVLQGIGDDAAILTPPPGHHQLASTDTFVEGVHFDRTHQTPRDIGYRVAAATISDIAAMGGRPHHLLVALAIPPRIPAAHVREIYRGIRDACRPHHIDLIGGDTTASSAPAVSSASSAPTASSSSAPAAPAAPAPLVLTLTILGAIRPTRALTRRRARIGDRLYVTGTLGDARAGLHIRHTRARRRPAAPTAIERYLTRRHNRPTPRLALAHTLATRGLAHAAIDLSDGLSGDVSHLCDQSRVGVAIRTAALPLSPQLRAYARHHHQDPIDLALRGGEDYELLFTAAPTHHRAILRLSTQTGVPITWIGDITPPRAGRRLIPPHGRPRPLVPNSYQHFAATPSPPSP